MNHRKLMLAAAAGLLLGAPLGAQEIANTGTAAVGADPGYSAYISERKASLAQSLNRRIAAIEQRFSAEMSFRAKLRDERIAFEKKMEKQESAFLDSLEVKDPPARMAAWSAYYDKTGREREAFYASLRQESSQFWEARLGAAAQEAPQALSAQTAK